MPTTSKAQHNLMEGVAHSKSFAEHVGIPMSVGKEFAAADEEVHLEHEIHRDSRDYHERQMKHHFEKMEDHHAKMIASHPDEGDAMSEHKIHHLKQEKHHQEMCIYHKNERDE